MSPRLLSLSEAVHQIVDATRLRSWQPHHQAPYFFIVGAGISYPPIPLAAGIEDLCRKEIVERGGTLPSINGTAMERYEAIFQAAFPHPEDRRAFLHHNIKSVRISTANFRLAHLVSAGKPANLVVTTNFDELLTKALRLFGRDVIVCDHPKTTQRIDPKRDDLQVIHAHGTHWFYDCCNLKDEIQHRAEDDREDNSSMSHLLDRILFDRSPLVVGYSGWEGDVVMGALKRRLKQPLRYNLYWFCFRRAEVDALPRWLKEHGHVRFVVPPEPPLEQSDGVGTNFSTAEQSARIVHTLTQNTEELRLKEATLPARQVFDALIQGFKLDEPELTKDPLNFFERLLSNLITLDESDENDIYLIKSVIRRVKNGADLAKQEMEKKSQIAKLATELLEQVNGFVRGASYHEAVEIAKKIDFLNLSDSQRLDLENALENIYLGIVDSNGMLGLEVCELRIKLCETARAQGDEKSDWLMRCSKSIQSKGRCLKLLGRTTEAIDAYDEVVRRFSDTAEPVIKEQVAKALLSKGLALNTEGKKIEAIAAYDEIVRRFGDAAEPSIKEYVARALVNKGFAFGKEGKRTEAIAAYDEVVRRFEDAAEPPLKERVARALVNKAVELDREGKRTEAIAVYADVVRRFDESAEPAVREQVAKALVYKGLDLGEEGNRIDAIAAYTEVTRRFGEATEPAIKEHVAKAFLFKGIDLGEEGNRIDAIAAYTEVTRRFGEATEPAIKEHVAQALINKAFAFSKEDNKAEAIATYDEVARRFGDAAEPALMEQVARALVNKGMELNGQGKTAEAIAAYDEVERRFGETSESELKKQVARALANKRTALGRKDKRR